MGGNSDERSYWRFATLTVCFKCEVIFVKYQNIDASVLDDSDMEPMLKDGGLKLRARTCIVNCIPHNPQN